MSDISLHIPYTYNYIRPFRQLFDRKRTCPELLPSVLNLVRRKGGLRQFVLFGPCYFNCAI